MFHCYQSRYAGLNHTGIKLRVFWIFLLLTQTRSTVKAQIKNDSSTDPPISSLLVATPYPIKKFQTEQSHAFQLSGRSQGLEHNCFG